MADSKGKKRKADRQTDGPPTKKVQVGSALAGRVDVVHIDSADDNQPIIANTSGIRVPQDIRFSAFAKPNSRGPSDLLLHSSDHPTIDYHGEETRVSNSSEKYFNHYVAVYDPAEKKLQITQARKMVITPRVRKLGETSNAADEAGADPQTYSTRAALTEAFGTKKSRKAVQLIQENRLLAQEGDPSSQAVSNAILSTLTDDLPLSTDLLSDPTISRSIKPLPVADLTTDSIDQVYSTTTLLRPLTLSQIPIKHWQTRISKGQEISTTTRFIAHRVGFLVRAHLTSPDDETLLQKVQVLRYIELLIELHRHMTSQPPRKPLLPVEKWTTPETKISISGFPSPITPQTLQRVINHFFPTRVPTPPAMTLLQTTILALTLHVPPPSLNPGSNQLITEPSDIGLDLALDSAQVKKLYRELGCRVETAGDRELDLWGLMDVVRKKKKAKRNGGDGEGDGDEAEGTTSGGSKTKFVKLRFPIEFPRVSQGRSGKGKNRR